jgi:hypothetical protein
LKKRKALVKALAEAKKANRPGLVKKIRQRCTR